VEIPGYGKDRLNAAYSYGGAAMLMQTIENNFRIEVDKYLETNFDGFEEIIDALGGIDVTMSQYEADFLNDWKNVGAVEGTNTLNGENALYFARMRKLDSDFGRTTRQRQVVSAIFQKLKSSNPITMYSAAYQLMPNLKTNLSYWELIRFAAAFSQMSDDTETLSIPSDGTYYDYTTSEGAMVLVPYLEENISLLRSFIYE
jgi:LCP family protein required for cell wall assembly